MPANPPARLQWAVQLLEVAPDDRLLEIGCGPGAAVALVGVRLTTGRITAVDRSTTAIDRAVRRNTAHIAAGGAVVEHCELAGLGTRHGPFDKIFAANVKLLGVRRAETEIDLSRRLLRRDGVLFYDFPGGDHASGFTTATTYGEPDSPVCITARRVDERSH